MATRSEVEAFLSLFKVKIDIWGVVFLDNREKNMKALADINITPDQRIEEVKAIQVEHWRPGRAGPCRGRGRTGRRGRGCGRRIRAGL